MRQLFHSEGIPWEIADYLPQEALTLAEFVGGREGIHNNWELFCDIQLGGVVLVMLYSALG